MKSNGDRRVSKRNERKEEEKKHSINGIECLGLFHSSSSSFFRFLFVDSVSLSF